MWKHLPQISPIAARQIDALLLFITPPTSPMTEAVTGSLAGSGTHSGPLSVAMEGLNWTAERTIRASGLRGI